MQARAAHVGGDGNPESEAAWLGARQAPNNRGATPWQEVALTQSRGLAAARSAALLQRRSIQFVLCRGAIDGAREIRHQSSEASQFSLETLYSLFGQSPTHVV
jgi:hypothetical protein